MVQRRYATIKPFRERDIPCATVEGLLLLKLYALPFLYRQGNFARVGLYENDIATLMHDYRPDLDPLFEELEPHLRASDIATLRDIVGDIRQRIARFGQGFGETP
jgi:predicted nucleotidyltransferase